MHKIIEQRSRLFMITALVSLGWIIATSLIAVDTTQGRRALPRQGFLAPDFNLPDASGAAYQLSSLTGNVVVINFWASWCPPCQAEMPAFERVHRALSDQRLLILAINSTSQDTFADASRFVNERGLTFSILYDYDGSVSRNYQVSALPTTFFLDKEGVIRKVVYGGPLSESLLLSEVQKLLEERR